jgi:hypothetical protein
VSRIVDAELKQVVTIDIRIHADASAAD